MTSKAYTVKMEPLEAWFLLQLLDNATFKGSESSHIDKLRKKFRRCLDGHFDKTGEYLGYTPPTQANGT